MKKLAETANSKQVFNLIIVDESGSMSVIRKQAFSGMNETLETIKAMQQQYPDTEQRVSLVTFDSSHTTWHYDNKPVSETKSLKWEDYNPGGCTPLYDAIGSSVSKVNAVTGKDDHVLVTIITDGEENSSREWKLTAIRSLIEKLKAEGWTFTLIGTDNLDVESMAGAMAIDEHLEFHQDEEGTKKMFARERHCRARYNACVEACVPMAAGSFFKED